LTSTVHRLHFHTLSFDMSILLGILTFILILVSLFLILVVLAQKTKDSGVGAALGGGAAEAAFGAETGNVLTRMTKYSAIIFFVLAFTLYLGRIYERKVARSAAGDALPGIAESAVPPAPVPGAFPGVGTAPVEAPISTTPSVTVPTTTPAADSTPAATPAAPATTPAEAPKTP
jgi:preprotein translocase subunit SecG